MALNGYLETKKFFYGANKCKILQVFYMCKGRLRRSIYLWSKAVLSSPTKRKLSWFISYRNLKSKHSALTPETEGQFLYFRFHPIYKLDKIQSNILLKSKTMKQVNIIKHFG